MNKTLRIVIFSILAVTILGSIGKIFEDVDAGEIVIIQDPFDGELHVYTQPGVEFQMWGRSTHYKKSFQYWFDGAEGHAPLLTAKFYDGGHASIPGSIRVDLPIDEKSMKYIHTKFGSQEAIENQLVGQVLIKAVTMSGPLMTSKESYAEKKNNLIFYVEDQATHGVYKTTQKEVKVMDQITNQEKVLTAVEIINDTKGLPLRQEKSMIEQSGIVLNNLSFGDFQYDKVVQEQIAAQQKQTMLVQTGRANAIRAEQDAITAEKQGQANAAKAKWEQETIKSAAVTEAERIRDVAKLTADAEEQNKRANILKGEGEAAYKRLVTQANNNLEYRIDAWVEVNKAYATAMTGTNLVPTYVSGGGYNGSGSNQAMETMNMFQIKTAKEILGAGGIMDASAKK
jgi:hypothetical protein